MFGARGYLPHEFYRTAYREGRIERRCLLGVLQALLSYKQVQWGGRQLSHLDVFLTVMADGIQVPCGSATTACAAAVAAKDLPLDGIERWLQTALPNEAWEGDDLTQSPDNEVYQETMAAWCDRTIGSHITEQIVRPRGFRSSYWNSRSTQQEMETFPSSQFARLNLSMHLRA